MKYTPANQFCQSRYEMSYADFRKALSEGDTVLAANRESTRSQKLNHNAKAALLQAVYDKLGLKDPFYMHRFTNSGRVCYINDGKGYYPKLKKLIHRGLARTPAGKKLYLLFVLRSRLAQTIATEEASERRRKLRFSEIDISPGAELVFKPDPTKKCRVVDDGQQVEYMGAYYNFSDLAMKFLREMGNTRLSSRAQGAYWFTYKDERLTERRDRLDNEEESA